MIRHARTGQVFDSTGRITNQGDLIRRQLSGLDIFNHTLSAEYTPLVERKPLPGISELRDRIVGPGAVDVVAGEIEIDATAGKTALYTRDYGRYLPGTVGLAGIGVRIPDTATGSYEYGYGNGAGNRIGIEWDDGEPYTFIESDGDRWYRNPRSNWLDPLDGTGPSGVHFDLSEGHILRIPFGWYGYLSVQFTIAIPGESEDQVIVVDRARGRPNAISIEQPDLPVFAEADGGTMYVGGRQFGVYGRYIPKERITGTCNVTKVVGESYVPIVTYQTKDETRWRGVAVQLSGVSLLSTENCEWALIINASLTGADFGPIALVPADETAIEADTSATAFTGGIKSYCDNTPGGAGNRSGADDTQLPDLNLPRELPVTLVARAITGTSTINAILRVREEW